MTATPKRARVAFIAMALVAASAVWAMPAHAATTFVVDDDGAATATDCNAAGSAFRSIQLAINAAASGDTVKVCPGEYNQPLVISGKGINLIGAKVGVNGATRAFGQNAESVIGTVGKDLDAIQVGPGASNTVVDGFTIQNSRNGVNTLNDGSGYIVRNNIIRNNAIGIGFSSSGVIPSVVTRNKITANNNGFSGGGAGEGCLGPNDATTQCGEGLPASSSGNGIYTDNGLSNATISGNFVGLNRNAGIFIFNCVGGVDSGIGITGNTLQNNWTDISLVDAVTGVTVTKNKTNDNKPGNDTNWGSSIFVGGTTGVTIGGPTKADGNTFNKAPFSSVRISEATFCGGVTPPSTHVVVQNNNINTAGYDGIRVSDPAAGRVEVRNNVLRNNGAPIPDIGWAGGDGIHFLAGTNGNVIDSNTATGSGIFDCHDESGPTAATVLNTWTNNTAVTESPIGICPLRP
jgi:hypothetical protein